MRSTRFSLLVLVCVLAGALLAPIAISGAAESSDSASGVVVIKQSKKCRTVAPAMDVSSDTKVAATLLTNVGGFEVQRVVRLFDVDKLRICLTSNADRNVRVSWIAHNGKAVSPSGHVHDGRYYTKGQVDALTNALATRLDALEAAQPGVWTNRTNSMAFAGDTTVVDVAVTAPAAGNFTVFSTTTVRENTGGEFVTCSLTDGTTLDVSYIQRWQASGTAGQDSQLAGVRVFTVTAGQVVTYRLVCRNASSGSSDLFDATIAALFTPAP